MAERPSTQSWRSPWVGAIATLLRGLLAFVLFGSAAVGYLVATRRTDRPPLWWIVLVTVVVAVALWWAQPLLEQMANRLVHRERADAEARMEDLLQGMAETLPVDEVVIRLAELAGRHRQRAEVRVWLADGTSWGQAWPHQAPQVDAAYRVDVVHGGDRVGEIEVAAGAAPLTPLDRRLLDELAAPAGVALSTVRLTVDLRRREAELTELNAALVASSDRLRSARADQQRRLRAEIDLRVVPHLSAAAALLGDGRGDRGPDPSRARHEATLALDELRTLARGLHPPRLLDDGLITSLGGWMERRDRAVVISGGPIAPLPDALVRAAYFCLITLLDALADADADQLRLAASDEADTLQLCVSGRPPAASAPDPATVQLVRDRLEAFDGSLTSSWSHDTVTFTARLPLPRPAELTAP